MFGDLYDIVKEVGNQTIIKFDKGNIIFKVHFEGNPILPGACMIEICRELIERKINRKLNIKNIKNVKFLQLISPEEFSEVVFDINISESENELNVKINISDITLNQIYAKINMILENA